MEATYDYGRATQPYWQRLPRFARLPLDKAVLLRIAGLAVGSFVAGLLPQAGPLGHWLWVGALLLLLAGGAAYAFRIVERSSKGYLIPSDYGLTDRTAVGALLPWKFAALVVALALAAVACTRLLGAMGVAALLLLCAGTAALLPVVTMRLVTTGSLRSAVGPLEAVQTIRKLGKPYAGLAGAALAGVLGGVFALYALGVLATGAAEPLSPGVGTALLAWLLAAVCSYYGYALAAMIGYAMFQYAVVFQLGLLGRGDERLKSSTGRHADVKARTRDALIGQMVTQGEIREAISLINDDLAQRPSDLSLHARLHKLLLAENYGPRIEDHTEKYLALLARSQNWREALDLAEEALARRADWSPRQVEHIAPLARAALQKGRPQLAATLIRGFDKKHPNHPDVPAVYLIGAQIMAESARKPDEARRIIEFLLQRYGNDPAALEARRYLSTI